MLFVLFEVIGDENINQTYKHEPTKYVTGSGKRRCRAMDSSKGITTQAVVLHAWLCFH